MGGKASREGLPCARVLTFTAAVFSRITAEAQAWINIENWPRRLEFIEGVKGRREERVRGGRMDGPVEGIDVLNCC